MRVSDPRSTYEVFYTAHPLGFLYTSSELGNHTVMLRRPRARERHRHCCGG